MVFYHEWISGCCTSPDVIFMDNHTTTEIKRVQSQSLIRLDYEQDLCLFFTDSTLNIVEILDLEFDKSTFIRFPKGLFISKMESSWYNYPRDFFNEISRTNDDLKIVYQYKNDPSEKVWTKDSLIVKL